MNLINLAPYADPDYGVLVPTALVLPALGLTDHGLRKFRPLLVENVDFLRQPGQGSIERIFYSANGLFKLADAAATSQAQQFKALLQPYLPQSLSPSQLLRDPAATAPRYDAERSDKSIVPYGGSQSVQPYSTSPGELDPYAPAQRSVPPPPLVRTVQPAPIVPHMASPTVTASPYAATESHSDPAAHIANQLAPHLAPAIVAQVGSQVNAALARLENRPKALTDAELLLEQQRISIQQFEAVQRMVVAAQESSTTQTKTLLESIPKPNVFVESNGFGDLIALMKSEGMQLLVGGVSLVFALAALASLFLRSIDSPSVPAPIPYQAPAPTVPTAPAAPVPLSPTPYPPPSP